MKKTDPMIRFQGPGSWQEQLSWEDNCLCLCWDGSLECVSADGERVVLRGREFRVLPAPPQEMTLSEGEALLWKCDGDTAGLQGRNLPLPMWSEHAVLRLMEFPPLPENHQIAIIDYLTLELLALVRSEPEQSVAQKVETYLREHLDEELSLDQLAAHFGRSRSAFLRDCLKEWSAPPMTVLARMRVQRAKELLQRPELTISQVGYQIGFVQLSSFSHFFKKHTGVSPRDYRQQSEWLL